MTIRDPRIPACDRPATRAVTYDPDGNGPRRLPYCESHCYLFTGTLGHRRVDHTIEELTVTEECTAYRDV